jgi:hypothetical protein
VIVDKPATADLVQGVDDEDELGISYHAADPILHALLNGHRREDLPGRGFDPEAVDLVWRRLHSTHWKRELPTVAVLSSSAIGEFYLDYGPSGLLMLLVIDNYDSFTFNLVQLLGALGEDPVVIRNDERTVAEIRAMSPERVVVSPGPCTPVGGGCERRAHPVARRRRRAGPGRVPRTPEPGRGVRWQDHTGPAHDAWEDGPDPS